MKEILIIKTTNSENVKSILSANSADYEVIFEEPISLTEEEIWQRDIYLASQDTERNKEIAEWNRISKVKDIQGW